MATPIAFVNSVAQLTNLIYHIGLGVNPILLGLAQMIPRLLDAMTDPIAGYLSDKTKSRWGRRRPYILFGGIAVSITFVLLWSVPTGLSEIGIFTYYLLMSLIFYTAVTIFTIPLNALGCEMSKDYHERTNLFAHGSFIGNVFALVTPWLYHLANLKVFKNEVEGMKFIGLLVAFMILFSAIICFLLCKEPKQSTKQSISKSDYKFWDSMKATWTNKAFRKLMISVFLVTAGFNFVSGFSNYVMIFYLFEGQKDLASKLIGINGTAWAITALVSVFPMTWSSKKWGKSKTIQFFILFMVIGSLLKIVCYDKEHPWLTLIPTVFTSSGMLVLFTMANSMIADICDEDEKMFGVRREGSFTAVYSWWLKLAISVAYLIAGILLHSTQFDETQIKQSSTTLYLLRFWDITLPTILCLVAFFSLRNYSITETIALENKKILENRHLHD